MIRGANANRNAATSSSFKSLPQMQDCIWPAATRPLFIKSVWMDRRWGGQGGYRHFILNTDWTSNDHEELHHNSKLTIPKAQHRDRRKPLLEPLEPRALDAAVPQKAPQLLDNVEGSSFEETTRNEKLRRQRTLPNNSSSTRKQLCKQLVKNIQTKSQKDSVSSHSLRNHFKESVNKKSGEEKVQQEFLINPEENYQLTERVLQWLDLAGKSPNLPATIEENRGQSSTGTVHPKSYKRVFTANPSLGGGATNYHPLKKTIPPLKRSESIHHLSLTLNEEELPSNNALHLSQLSGKKLRQMSSSKGSKAIGAVSAASQSNSQAKGLSLMSPKSTTSSSSSASAGASSQNINGNKSKGGKKKSLGKLGKTESIENQYRSMIHRQLLETSCNTQLAKRQLHIFMPNPKLGTAQSNDCDSCLNSLISEGSKN